MVLLHLFSFLAGFCTIISPCVLPVLPIILASGASRGRLRPFGVVLGLIISFTLFTLTLTALVRATGISPTLLRSIAVVLIFLFGLIMLIPTLSEWFSTTFNPLASLGSSVQESTPTSGFLGGLVLGLATGLLWTPCAGPILAAITTLVATQSTTVASLSLVFTYVIGASIPLFVIALGERALLRAPLLASHLTGIRQGFGLLTMCTAVAIAFHWDTLAGQKIAQYIPTVVVDENKAVQTELKQLESAQPSTDSLTSYGPAPEFIGLTDWINSPPLSLKELRGKVVLVDFWTYSCINCLRTLPHLEEWYKKYQDKGFIIIGIQTPEFEFEKNPNNVSEAVTRLGITYPVAQDNNYSVWREYNNRYWPTHYLIDQNGQIVGIWIGEGEYAQTERAIQSLLGLSQPIQSFPKSTPRPITPETYLGTARGRGYTEENTIIPDQTNRYSYGHSLGEDQAGLQGPWKAEAEYISAEGDDCTLSINFLGRQAYIVLGGSSSEPVEVILDGEKTKEIYVNLSRKYDIVDTAYGRHTVLLKMPKGIRAYTFTFGDEQ